jgi:hypothetical protein
MRPWPCLCNLVAVAAIALTATTGQAADPDFIPVTSEAGTIPAIAKCLRQSMEAVLLSNGVQCTSYREGSKFLKKKTPNAPFEFVADRDCPEQPSGPVNARRLSADAVQQLMTDSKLGPTGIRIIGAIFCKRANLVGLNLPFSLVLDNSVFGKGIEIRNLEAQGDISLDGTLILDETRIIRSHIKGSLFGDESFINKLSIGSSTIDTSASFTDSVLFESAQLYNGSIAKEFSVRGSALSYFITQFSYIGGALDLSHSEARCAYHINKSTIGYLVARRAGFGTVEPPSQKPPAYYVWRADFNPTVTRILTTPEIQQNFSTAATCTNPFGQSYRAEFFVFDSIIKSSLCITEFRWLAPRDAGPYTSAEFFAPRKDTEQYLRTVVAINGDTIGGNLIIDLWPKDTGEANLDYKVAQSLHKLEVIGVKASGLIIDFLDKNQSHVITAVDGLNFDRVYSAPAACEYGGSKSAPAIYDQRTLSIITDFTETLELPKVEDALKWLDLNKIVSTQPYTAFATAFKNAGVDSTAIDIARENRELCERAARWLPFTILRRFCRTAAEIRESEVGESQKKPAIETTPASLQSGWHELGMAFLSIPSQLADLAQLGFRGGLYFLADHGYRPGKVLWWVTLTLVVFWLWFIWPLKVVAYTSKTGSLASEHSPADIPKMRPLGFSFLFDRLLPAYQIDSAHYEIESYFKRVAVSETAGRMPPPPVVRRLLFFEWPVERVTNQREVEHIEKLLRVLRILGVVFAIFLGAAVSALIVH